MVGSSSTCSGFAKVLLRCSAHQSCSPQMLGQILPAFPTESRENTILFPKQCLNSFENPLTTHWCGIQKRATKLHEFIQIQPPTQSLVRGHWPKHLLCFSNSFLMIQTDTGIREGFTEAHISSSAEEFKGSHDKHSLPQELPPACPQTCGDFTKSMYYCMGWKTLHSLGRINIKAKEL